MHQDPRRITLIHRDPKTPDRDWDVSQNAPTHILIIDSFTVLRYALTSRVVDFDLDVERVVLDRSTSPSEYLELLAELPATFTGDVVLIRPDDDAFLSAMARGGDRVLYTLSASDLRFYLEVHDLVTGRIAVPTLPRRTPARARSGLVSAGALAAFQWAAIGHMSSFQTRPS